MKNKNQKYIPIIALIETARKNGSFEINSTVEISIDDSFFVRTEDNKRDTVLALTVFNTLLELEEDSEFIPTLKAIQPIGAGSILLKEHDIRASLNFVAQYLAQKALENLENQP